MDEQVVQALLLLAAAVAAFAASVRDKTEYVTDKFLPRVNKVALALGLAATAFFIQVSDILKGF